MATLAPSSRRHVETLAEYFKTAPGAEQQVQLAKARRLGVVEWGEKNYYIPSDEGGGQLIKFLPHQKIIMRLFFDQAVAKKLGVSSFQTIIFSTVKKSGKTALAGLVARWIAETWGSHGEVYCMANDLEQARGRIYSAALSSIELDPRHTEAAKGIPGLWRIVERGARYIPTHSIMRAVSSDYKGEAGSNPVATLWSELWGYTSEIDVRLWEELTPVPTRPRSVRYVETYSGFEGESTILNKIEDRIKKDELRMSQEQLAELVPDIPWPWPDQRLPFFVHAPSRTIAYWDVGVEARRMPWQTPEYYASQTDLREAQFRRLHLNERVSPVDDFIPIQWWDRLEVISEPLDESTPVVVGADASVTGDCTAICAVSRHPDDPEKVAVRLFESWNPPDRGSIDYGSTIEPALRDWCSRYNVVELAYDQYQLHDMMTRFSREAVAWCRPFSQMGDRLVADKALYDCIRDMRMARGDHPMLREHISGCAAKFPPDDNTRLRLIKKAPERKIDGAVALSMAAHECKRLNL